MKKKQSVRPDGHIRQSQMVTTFGPGAMVDLVDHAVLVAGLDFWSYDKKATLPLIKEPRLRETIAEKFLKLDDPRPLSLTEPFICPPASDDSEPSRFVGVQVLEFPQWFVCQNPNCRALMRGKGLKKGNKHDCPGRKKPSPCVPVRFVTVCRRGHLDEFPWVSFVHDRGAVCAAPSLKLTEGASGDFREIVVRCACGAFRPMSDAKSPEFGFDCQGRRPWLGPEAQEDCQEKIRLLVRTASNSYFAQVESALSIPDPGRELELRIRREWKFMKDVTADNIETLRTLGAYKDVLRDAETDLVLSIIDSVKKDKPVTTAGLRTAEFLQITAQPLEKPGEKPPSDVDFFARRCNPPDGLPAEVSRLVLVFKLREVQAQVGFTRLEAMSTNLQGEHDLGVESAALSLSQDWLPASELQGEGIFLELDEEAVREWEDRPVVRERGKELLAGFEAWNSHLEEQRKAGGVKEPSSVPTKAAPPFPGVRFYLLHSLSHLLMSTLSLECGYSASGLKERIYCAARDDEPPMAAILIMTGSSGAEGTLGGLVEKLRRRRNAGRARRAGTPDRSSPAPGDPVGYLVLERSGLCRPYAARRLRGTVPGRRGLSRLPLRGGMLVRTLQPLPGPGVGSAGDGARSGVGVFRGVADVLLDEGACRRRVAGSEAPGPGAGTRTRSPAV
ncbi:MAG: DrmB family protein [Planctomycetota bacterium]|jgi:hypothetical protein